MAIDKNKYKRITGIVIDKLEGGYYHPDMLADGRVKSSLYGSSGETMFGIDRRTGGSLNTSPAGVEFWSIIDNANARKNWKWLYRGGSLEPKLRELTAEIMYPQFDYLSNKYLTPEAKKIVESDDRLLFNFIYATWNGSGFFRDFSEDFNSAVASGIKDKDALVKVAINSRINNRAKSQSGKKLIAQGGEKIALFIDQLKNVAEETAEKAAEYTKRNWLPILLIGVGVAGLIYFTYYYKGKGMNKNLKLT